MHMKAAARMAGEVHGGAVRWSAGELLIICPSNFGWLSVQMGVTTVAALLAAMATSLVLFTAQAADPELTTDFFAAAGVNKSTLTGAYFTDTSLRTPATFAPGVKFAIQKVNSESFVALTGLGVSSALLTYLPGGINPLHTHPRGTELLVLRTGVLTVGLVDSTNKLFTQVLQPNDVFVFPRGLVHFQINLGKKTAVAYAAFSSSNPGTISLPGNLFGSGIADNVLQTAFKVSEKVVDALQAPFTT